MKSKILILILISVALNATSQDLKPKLEANYKAFVDAVMTKDPAKLKVAMSAYAYANLKNRMSSAGAKFPDAFFAAGPQMLKDLGKMKYHQVVVNGGTANALYSESAEGETTIVILKFLKEGDDWKFNMFDMRSSDEINAAAKTGNFSFLTGKDYQPDGIVPAPPSEVATAEVKGMIDVFCYEYVVTVSINGNEQRATDNKSSSGWIVGGLKKGKNKITISSKPIPGGKPATITVTIRIMAGDDEKTVFTYEQASPTTSVEKEFEIK